MSTAAESPSPAAPRVPTFTRVPTPTLELPKSPHELAADLVDPPGLSWRRDPRAWANERGTIFLWSRQVEVLEAVRDHPRVAVKSCHSAGKSFDAAAATAWWLDTHPTGTAFVLTTAPTGDQVKAVLWREINKLHVRAQLPGKTNLKEWYIGGELVAIGRKPSEHTQAGFQGIHALYVLVILDEACGVPNQLWTAAETIASNRHSRILAIGNPDDADTEFGRACAADSGWKVITISYRDTPNFTDEPVPDVIRDLLVSRAWVEDKVKRWGVDSALFQSKCLGEFPRPETNPWAVVPYGWAQRCRELELSSTFGDLAEAGVDIGAGGDRTVIRERRGPVAGRELVFIDPDPEATVGKLAIKLREWGIQRVKVDVIGVGWGVYGRLRALSARHGATGVDAVHHAEVIPVNAANKSRFPTRFLNVRAEMWWNARELARTQTWDLGACDDDTIAELTAPRYEILDSRGKIKIESKDDIRDRLEGRSTDHADALLMAFYDPRAAYVDNFAGAETIAEASFGATALAPGNFGQSAADDRQQSPWGALRRLRSVFPPSRFGGGSSARERALASLRDQEAAEASD